MPTPRSDYPPLKKGSSKKDTSRALTEKQRSFIDNYLITMNGAEAVRKAGYNTKNAHRMATELLHNARVRDVIEEELQKKRERNALSADYVIQKLIDIVEEQERGNPQAALRGLELLGKHLGLYRDKQEISGPDGQAIEMEQRIKEDVASFTDNLSRLAKKKTGTDDDSTVVPFKK